MIRSASTTTTPSAIGFRTFDGEYRQHWKVGAKVELQYHFDCLSGIVTKVYVGEASDTYDVKLDNGDAVLNVRSAGPISGTLSSISTGSKLIRFLGAAANDKLGGGAGGRVGDINDDNIDDIAFGASQADPLSRSAADPSANPSLPPTLAPSVWPTIKPSHQPTLKPSMDPTAAPTVYPTLIPTNAPTAFPTSAPTVEATLFPTAIPTNKPTVPALLNYEVVVNIEQELLNVTKAEYDAHLTASNLTIQHTVADAVDGVIPERVTDIVVEEEEEEGGRRSDHHHMRRHMAQSRTIMIRYKITLKDPSLAIETVRAQLQKAAREGVMDSALRIYAVQ
eukprot:gene14877-17065_t